MANLELFDEETRLLSQSTAPLSKASKPGNLIIDSRSVQPPAANTADTADDNGRHALKASFHETVVVASEELPVIAVSSNTTADMSVMETAPVSASTLELTAPAETQPTSTTDSFPAVEMMETTSSV